MVIVDFSVEPPPGVGDVDGLALVLGLTVELGELDSQVTIGTQSGGEGIGPLLADGLALGFVEVEGFVEPEGCATDAAASELPGRTVASTFSTTTAASTSALVLRIISFQDLTVFLLNDLSSQRLASAPPPLSESGSSHLCGFLHFYLS
jgi:hypothetical protein